MKKQLDITSMFGQIATILLVAFFVERVASAHLGVVWGAALTVGMMLAVLAGVVLWTRLKRKE